MIVSHRHRLVFIHVQKTGGSSVTRALNAALEDACEVPGSKHAKMESALSLFPEASEYFVMGFVRNPWARLFSWHAMIMRRHDEVAAGSYDARLFERNRFWQRVAIEFPDFESFVLEGTRTVRRLRVPQISYLTTPERPADFIGRTETLESDLSRGLMLAGLNAPAAVARNNAGPSTDYRNAYSEQMVRRVEDVYARDIAEFGYSF